MSDLDQTIVSSKGMQQPAGAPPPPEKKRNPFLLIGGIGCVLLLCLALGIGGGVWFASDQMQDLLTGLDEPGTPTLPATVEAVTNPSPTEELPPTSTPITDSSAVGQTPTDTPVVESDTPTVSAGQPTFGIITFALDATDTYEPIDSGTSFEEGITEVHAIFDYSGMSPNDTWERVWYLDGNEILRNSATWTDQGSGRFDYFIDAGGDPLLPGQWDLELYVNGKLIATGSFVIESEEQAQAAQATNTPSPEPETDEPTATPVPATSSGGGVYKLAYSIWDGGQYQLYVADTNGNNQQFIMNRAAGPSWTPDGATLFFYGSEGVDRQDRSDNPNVESCELSGVSNGVLAIDMPSPPNDICISRPNVFQGSGWNEGTARWANVSPDGQMVSFDGKPGGNYRIYFLGTSDNQQFRYEIDGEQADWSPDSQKVVYRSGRNGITGIWISNRDDTGHTNITQNGSDSFPAWSPDGKTIAFSREQDGNVDIYTMNIDGANIQRLTDAPGPDTLPVYTPSGDIIFRSARTGGWSIWKMSGSGANQTEIISNAGLGDDWSFGRMDVQ